MRRDASFVAALLGALAVSISSAPEAHALGYLIPAQADVEPLAIRYHRVGVSIRERVAETRVEQTFRNHTERVLEATYVFPVPEGASVSGFSMWVNGERRSGELLEAGQARRVYEQIVARMRDPGLVEHMGGHLFRARVFPIQPHSEQRIEIRFSQTLDYQGSVVHYRYPLHTTGRAAQTLEDFTFTADLVSRTAIRAVYSPTHAISVSRPDEHRATVGFEAHRATLDEDLDLYYAVQDRDVGLSLLTHRPRGEDGYFLAMIAPRAEIAEREIAAKEVLFVFDTSGSMAGEKLRRAQAALDYMLRRLNPSDRFQIVRFSTAVEALFDGGGSVPATPANVARARRFGSRFVAAGGTAIHGALREALRTRRPASMPRLVVFLTDGMPTVGETDVARITADATRWAGDGRVYVFGVGDDVNTTFLDGIARRTQGVGEYFRDGAEMERRLSGFYDRIAYPLFTDLRLRFPGLEVHDVYPRDLGHLYRGGQLLVVGRYRGAGPSQLVLEGRVAGETETQRFGYRVAFPAREPRNDFLPRIWATRKIGFLLDEIRLHGERPELRDAVVRLAQRFGVVTPYTSYLVVEDEAVPPGLARTQRPRTGVDFADDEVEGELRRPRTGRARLRSGGRGGGDGDAPAAEAQVAEEDFRAFRGATVPRESGGSGGGPTASAAPPAATGERGRRLSRRLRRMREAERVRPSATTSRRVGDRTFRLVRGMWVDAAYRRALPTLRIRAASEAWFALLRARPALRSALALGERVAIALDGRAVIVAPDAPADVTEARVRAFLEQR
ncbi:MAG TPA: VIT domain-containing protein [Sandaracinaceae bacterium LLY-WYZ-13_1]|nr:VIT domain-containing protein [Sandaracinaceae bacterium LLY-WYZ-13_1]